MSLYLFVYAAIALFHSLHQRLWIYLCSPLFNSPTIYPPHQRLWIYVHLPTIYIPIIHPPHQRLWIYQLLQLNFLGFILLTRGSDHIIIPTKFPRIHPPHQGLWIYHHFNNWISENSPFSPRALNPPSYRPSSSPGIWNLAPLAITYLFQQFILLTRGSESTHLFIYISSSSETLKSLPTT